MTRKFEVSAKISEVDSGALLDVLEYFVENYGDQFVDGSAVEDTLTFEFILITDSFNEAVSLITALKTKYGVKMHGLVLHPIEQSA